MGEVNEALERAAPASRASWWRRRRLGPGRPGARLPGDGSCDDARPHATFRATSCAATTSTTRPTCSSVSTTPRPGGRCWAELIDPVITEEEWGENPPWTLNVALTASPGCEAVGLDRSGARDGSRRSSACGMAARADELGDVGTSAPDRWEKGLRLGRDPSAAHRLRAGRGACGTRSSPAGSSVVEQEPGLRCRLRAARRRAAGRARALRLRRRLLPARGRGQRPRSSRRGRAPAACVAGDRCGWASSCWAIATRTAWCPAGDFPLLHNGTFMVWRKLEQNVALFRSLGARGGGRRPGRGGVDQGEDRGALAQRRLAGALARRPRLRDSRERNRFLYGGDSDGLRCPVGAHVRRAYPRDALGFRTERTRRHRLLRRGMPYGSASAGGCGSRTTARSAA